MFWKSPISTMLQKSFAEVSITRVLMRVWLFFKISLIDMPRFSHHFLSYLDLHHLLHFTPDIYHFFYTLATPWISTIFLHFTYPLNLHHFFTLYHHFHTLPPGTEILVVMGEWFWFWENLITLLLLLTKKNHFCHVTDRNYTHTLIYST